MTDFDTMPIEEVRDAVARMLGWNLEESSALGQRFWNHRGPSGFIDRAGCVGFDPVPMTLDAVAGLMPEGWCWRRIGQNYFLQSSWAAGAIAKAVNQIPDAFFAHGPTELEARLRCIAKVLSHKEAS